MAVLTIHKGPQKRQITFDAPKALSVLLIEAGELFQRPCGGRGVCGKCAVVLAGSVSEPNMAELRCMVRLACQAVVTGDAEVTLPTEYHIAQIAGGAAADFPAVAPMPGRYGAAVDVGTTTIALLLYELASGRCLGASSMLNPQASIAADVIGRMDAAMKGQAALLQSQAENAMAALLASACAQANIPADQVEALVVTGNTTMLYLLSGYAPDALSHAPFAADHLFGCEAELLTRQAYYPTCLHAFVGADTSCALLASGMLDRDETALLCDVGTNGELALWHQGRLYVASTAAGPAFEGAGISCGCASIPGAIDQVEVDNGRVICHTIDGGKAVGVCGSGLVDAVAAMLDTGVLDETGLMDEQPFFLRDGIVLTQSDIRAVQLAKAAIHAGIISLLSAAQCPVEQVATLYLAGGFGSRLNLQSAVRIGLLPGELADCVRVIGNAALDGAAMLLLDTRLREKLAQMAERSEHVRLDGNPVFTNGYIEAMMFAEE